MCCCNLNLSSSVHAIVKLPMNLVETAMSASCGHGKNQSMVHPLMSPGKFRARVANLSPTGEKHRHTWRLSRTRPRKKAYRLSQVSITPGASFLSAGRMSLTIMSSSSLGNSPATSPVMRIWLINSRNPSSLISASVKMKHTFWPLSPATLYSALRSSNSATVLYCFEIVIWNVKAPEMYAARRVRLCLPEPPTPTRRAEPRSMHNRRAMRIMCASASEKSTRSSLSDLEVSLKFCMRASATPLRESSETVDS
mmetsp:Transcript_13331/g.21687  ORF Transcript_13331/g.21687 Transcript_13331/m.21687 type:complete len:253 (+) Transcript_13331:2108-2866(+)